MEKFSQTERDALKTAKFVGDKVIDRLEEIGINNCARLAQMSADEICNLVAAHLGASCWKNSPQSKAAINNAIAKAQSLI